MIDQIRAVVPPDCPLPIEIHAQDESRWGLQTIQRRRITLKGVKPCCAAQHAFANTWLYSTVAPASGDHFALILPKLNTANMQIFVDAFAAAFPHTFNVLILDNSAVHRTTKLRLPPHVALVFLPPYSPELNPVERFWEVLRSKLAWKQFADLDALEAAVCAELAKLTPTMIQSLTAYPYLTRAIAAIGV